jgi:hypothetical protein
MKQVYEMTREQWGKVLTPVKQEHLNNFINNRLLPVMKKKGPGLTPRPSERPRHHPRVGFARAAGGHRVPEGEGGLGYALVHHHGQLRRRLRRAPVSSTAAATRRWEYMELSRCDPAWTPGDLGGLVGRLPEPSRTNGGTGTNSTRPTPRLTGDEATQLTPRGAAKVDAAYGKTGP